MYMVKNLPSVWETWVRSLGRQDPLEKEMATHSSTLAWKIPWMEESGRLQPAIVHSQGYTPSPATNELHLPQGAKTDNTQSPNPTCDRQDSTDEKEEQRPLSQSGSGRLGTHTT